MLSDYVVMPNHVHFILAFNLIQNMNDNGTGQTGGIYLESRTNLAVGDMPWHVPTGNRQCNRVGTRHGVSGWSGMSGGVSDVSPAWRVRRVPRMACPSCPHHMAFPNKLPSTKKSTNEKRQTKKLKVLVIACNLRESQFPSTPQ
jgi:hypothetical protein